MEQREYQTAKGREEPFAVQFSVFLANRIGQLKDLVSAFVEKKVSILGMSIIDSTDWAVVRLVVSDSDEARALLAAHKLPFTESNVLMVELHGDGALPKMCCHLLAAEINVHFAYTLAIRSHDNPVMVFHVDDPVMATQTLLTHGFTLLGHEDIGPED